MYRSSSIVRVIKSIRLRWADDVRKMGEGRSAFKFLTGKPTRKKPLRNSRRKREDNIRMHITEIGVNTRNWVDLAQERDYLRALVNAALNLRVA